MSDPPVARQRSVCNVAATILHDRPTSQVQLAPATALSKRTIFEVVLVLEVAVLVGPVGRTGNRGGRWAVTYGIRPQAASGMGGHLHHTPIRAAWANLSCSILAEEVVDTDRQGGQAVVRQIGSFQWKLAPRGRRRARMGAVAIAFDQLHDELFGSPDLSGERGSPPPVLVDAA